MLKGMICLWFGLINAIPDGWLVCDGTNDTPDLRNKFIVCAGDIWDPGDTGGDITSTHIDSFMTNTHTRINDSAIHTGSGINATTLINWDSFTTEPGPIIPPYHALAYIMKEG